MEKERIFACSRCSKTFSSRQRAETHELIHDGVFPHSCGECGKSFRQKPHLARHSLTHLGLRPHACAKCPDTFRQFAHLEAHILFKHSDDIPKAVACTMCDKRFRNNSDLKVHMRSRDHENAQPFVCTVCPKRFTTTGNLSLHMRFCKDVRNYACSVCPRVFHTAQNLTVHMRIHEEVRPYPCAVCGHESRTQGQAVIHHRRVHTTDRPCACTFPMCEAAFVNGYELKAHFERTHSAEGQARHHKEEQKMVKFLDARGYDYRREHQVNMACAIPGATFARADFVLVFGNTVVFLEVDEHQHDGYGVSCDVQRMAKIVESIRCEGNSMRVVFVRYNPHSYSIGGVPFTTKPAERLELLGGFLERIRGEAPAPDACDMRVVYLFYDIGGDRIPSIFEDPEYPEIAKEWVAWFCGPMPPGVETGAVAVPSSRKRARVE